MRLLPGEAEPSTPLAVAALCRARAKSYRSISLAETADLLEVAAGVIETQHAHLGRGAPRSLPADPSEPVDQAEHRYWASRLGRLGGKKGGAARAELLSPERRSEIASEAARKRWAAKRAQAVQAKQVEPLTMAAMERMVLGPSPTAAEPKLVPVSKAERDAILAAAKPKPAHPF